MWTKLKIDDNLYCIKQEFSSESLEIIFSDFIIVSEEVLSHNEAISRFKSNNPEIQDSDNNVLEFIKSFLVEGLSEFSMEINGLTIILKMVNKTNGMNFFFELTKKSEESVFREITLPLLLLVNELKHRQEILYKELEAKDVEILEYRLDGFKITRKNVITSQFQREEFERESDIDMKKRLIYGIENTSNIFEENVNKFYHVYKNVASAVSTDLLKKCKFPEEMKEKPAIKVVEEVKSPPKRKYAPEPNVPIKRTVQKKRII